MNKPMQPRTRELIDKGRRYYVPNYRPRETVLDHGKGARLWDLDGNEYIDFGTGISVNSLGHQDPDLVEALVAQAHKLWHTSNVYYTEPAVQLAEELVNSCCAERVFFCNSGAEANEAAIKLARKWASQNLPAHRRDIITFYGSFHGRTLTTVTATAQPKYQEGFEPLPGGFRYCDFNDFAAIEAMLAEETACAVLLEPIQGEGGVTPSAPGFLAHLRALCDKHNVLLMCDEVQCGMGRTGHLWAHAWAGVEPDVITIAKALGGGVPIGAMLAGAKVAEVLGFGSHGSTFGGNPVMSSVARVALRKISSPALLANVTRQGQVFHDTLVAIGRKLDMFQEVRGVGLILGAQLNDAWKGKAGDLTEICRLHGVLILQAGPDVLRFLPPLNITDEELQTGLERLEAGLAAAYE